MIRKRSDRLYLFIFLTLPSTLVIGLYFWWMRADPTKTDLPKSPEAAVSVAPASFTELLVLNARDLDKTDIATMDLLCAQGLPGSDNLHLDLSLRTLDQWAQQVKETRSVICIDYTIPGMRTIITAPTLTFGAS